jgi:hypothetical protein
MPDFAYVDTPAGRVPVMQPRLMDDLPLPRASRRPHATEIGVTGTIIQSGMVLQEEFNQELTWKEGLRTWDMMRRTEPQIASTLKMIGLPIRAAAWKLQPGTASPEDIEKAALAETALFHGMRRSWDNLLRHILLHLDYGFMLFEQTWKTENGRTLIRDIAPRMPRTLNKWLTAPETNELVGVQQWAWTGKDYKYLNIPADVLIHFANQMEGQNYEGMSILRTAYKPYWYKQNFERIQAVGFEREWVGVPVITLPDGYTNDDLARAEKIGKNLRSHEQAHITLPPGWTADWLKSAGASKKGTSILDMLYYLDRQMQQNVLAQFMSLGTTDVGSYALSNDQSRVFLMALQATAGYIAETLNAKTIKRLIDYNYPTTAVYPKLIYQRIHAYNFVDLTTSIANLVATQVIPISAELEDYVYDLLGVPIPPHTAVETTNPAGGITPIKRPDSQIGPVGGDQKESAGGVGLNEVYRARHAALSGTHAEVFARMARDAGRPSTTIRLGPGQSLQWASAEPQKLLSARSRADQDATLARRLQVTEAARKEAEAMVDDLTERIEEMLSGRAT